jgi:hypothetical protein
MASRNKNSINFSSISYTAANYDTRWYLEVGQGAGEVSIGDNAAKAAVITDLFNSNGVSGNNDNPFGLTAGDVTHGDVIVAVRIPQTKRVLDVAMLLDAASDSTGLFASKNMQYDIYVSGRSDKKYTEIIDWVKICDNLGQISDSTASADNVFLPIDTGATYVKNLANRYHARSFPYYCSWVKLVFKNVQTRAGVPDLFINRVELYDFEEDLLTAEDEPTIEIVFPNSNSKWLPSQTAYTSLILIVAILDLRFIKRLQEIRH